MNKLISQSYPVLDAAQFRELDQQMITTYHVSVVQLMELAGLAVAQYIRGIYREELSKQTILICCGKGNNGGDGLVAARYLANWGATVRVMVVPDTGSLGDVPKKQLQSVTAWGIPVASYEPTTMEKWLSDTTICVDALIGFSLSGPPRGVVAECIRHLNDSKKVMVAVDCPSGLDASTGTVHTPCIAATHTVTMAALKTGFGFSAASARLGTLYVADIGVPPAAIQQMLDRSHGPYRFTELVQPV